MADKKVAVVEVKQPELTSSALTLVTQLITDGSVFNETMMSDQDRLSLAMAQVWLRNLNDSIKAQLR